LRGTAVSDAGEELGVSTSALSHAMRNLEARLGVFASVFSSVVARTDKIWSLKFRHFVFPVQSRNVHCMAQDAKVED
jgi:hypothetical protein